MSAPMWCIWTLNPWIQHHLESKKESKQWRYMELSVRVALYMTKNGIGYVLVAKYSLTQACWLESTLHLRVSTFYWAFNTLRGFLVDSLYPTHIYWCGPPMKRFPPAGTTFRVGLATLDVTNACIHHSLIARIGKCGWAIMWDMILKYGGCLECGRLMSCFVGLHPMPFSSILCITMTNAIWRWS